MKKLRIAIAIPTYNRIEKLKYAFNKIENQVFDSNIELVCVICNTASTDSTHEYLKKLKSNKVSLVIHTSLENSIYINWARCFELVPKDVDWVWLHGDDDFLFENLAVDKVCKLILAKSLEHPDLAFVHACQARRSQNTQQVFHGTLFDLCNTLGYHEMLGWMSSLIIKSDIFFENLVPSLQYTYDIQTSDYLLENKVSAYLHSAIIFKNCLSNTALFIDIPLIEPQDTEQTAESLQRWQVTHEAERYFFVVDDLLKMKEEGILTRGVKTIFFRYLTYSIFDRYTDYLTAQVVNNGILSERDKQHLLRMENISTLLSEPLESKLFLQWLQEFESNLLDYEYQFNQIQAKRTRLVKAHEISQRDVYPFKVL